MIVVIADDLSGAAELAGIAAARGFRAEVQTRFDPSTDAEVVAVDTDSRLLSRERAAVVVSETVREVVAADPEWIYKKTDSVMRGHVAAEIAAILNVSGKTRSILVPANPSKGRTIRAGRYFIDGIPLVDTTFANDPDFPARSSAVADLLGEAEGIEVPEVGSLEDVPDAVAADILPAGASDFFGRLLGAGRPTEHRIEASRTLLICGSLAAWDGGRGTEMERRGFRTLRPDEADAGVWNRHRRVMLAIGRPDRGTPRELLDRLVEAALPLVGEPNDLRIALEGGATAKAVLSRMGWNRFPVVPENHLGTGTLRPDGGPLLSIKPGSYPWPASLFPPMQEG